MILIKLVGQLFGGPIACRFLLKGNSPLHPGHNLYPMEQIRPQCWHVFVGHRETSSVNRKVCMYVIVHATYTCTVQPSEHT